MYTEIIYNSIFLLEYSQKKNFVIRAYKTCILSKDGRQIQLNIFIAFTSISHFCFRSLVTAVRRIQFNMSIRTGNLFTLNEHIHMYCSVFVYIEQNAATYYPLKGRARIQRCFYIHDNILLCIFDNQNIHIVI